MFPNPSIVELSVLAGMAWSLPLRVRVGPVFRMARLYGEWLGLGLSLIPCPRRSSGEGALEGRSRQIPVACPLRATSKRRHFPSPLSFLLSQTSFYPSTSIRPLFCHFTVSSLPPNSSQTLFLFTTQLLPLFNRSESPFYALARQLATNQHLPLPLLPKQQLVAFSIRSQPAQRQQRAINSSPSTRSKLFCNQKLFARRFHLSITAPDASRN